MNIHYNLAADKNLLWFGKTLVTIRLESDTGADGISVIEHRMPFGEAPPLHVHHTEDEVFHILSGKMRFLIGGKEMYGIAGDTVLAPKGVPHAFRVESPEGAQCLTVVRGRDFETMLRQASRPAQFLDLPRASEPTPDMIEMLVKCCAANGIEILGPPLV